VIECRGEGDLGHKVVGLQKSQTGGDVGCGICARSEPVVCDPGDVVADIDAIHPGPDVAIEVFNSSVGERIRRLCCLIVTDRDLPAGIPEV